MLKINFLNSSATSEMILNFAKCVKFESCEMQISINNAKIEKCKKIALNEKMRYSDEEIELAKKQAGDLEKENTDLKLSMDNLRSVYDQVISDMIKPNDQGYRNDLDQVRTVLRLIACADNRKFYEIATIPSLNDDMLYSTLESLHVLNNVTDDGYSTMSKDRKEKYKMASSRLDAIVRKMYSLPIKTPYTSALKIKLNASDRKAIHDVYVKGLKNEFKIDKKTGDTILKSSGYITSVKVNKHGKDYSKLAKDIAMVVIRKYTDVK